MASAAVTANTARLYVLESDGTEREFTNALEPSQFAMTIQNVGGNPAAVSLASSIGVDPDSPTQTAGEAVIPVNGSLPLPKDTITFYHTATTATVLNVILDKR